MRKEELDLLDDAEEIVRAIRSSDWDEAKKRYSSNLFTGPDTSVSRLSVLELDAIFEIFFSQLHKPPVHKVERAGQISVGRVKELGQQFENNGRSDPRKVTVVVDPQKDNAAHALIQQKLPRKLAFDIIDNLMFHEVPEPSKARKLWGKMCGFLSWVPFFKRFCRPIK